MLNTLATTDYLQCSTPVLSVVRVVFATMALVMGVDFKSWITSSTMVLFVLMKTTFKRMAELAEITSSLCLEFTGNLVIVCVWNMSDNFFS